MTEQKKHLYYMDELSDYKVSDGYPDIRGWDVKDIDNRVIGKVDNLLVNKEAQRVVYLDVEVNKSIIDAKYDPYGTPNRSEVREFVNKDGENHVIIPIGLVDLNTDSDYVYTEIIDHRTFAETKRYRKGDSINRQYENQVLSSYGRKSKDRNVDSDNDMFEDENRLREIIREEIEKYHRNRDTDQNHNRDKDLKYNKDNDLEYIKENDRKYNRDNDLNYTSSGDNDDIDDAEIITDEDMELRRRRENDIADDDDRFYDRKEFDDKRFKKRTPGL